MADTTGYIYCPPDWDEAKLRTKEAADAIRLISQTSYTDISFVESNNSIQIIGDCREDVVRAQTQLNVLFFPPEIKSKKSWARPDRPGSWGQRRDITNIEKPQDKKKDDKKKVKGKKSLQNLAKRSSTSGKENSLEKDKKEKANVSNEKLEDGEIKEQVKELNEQIADVKISKEE
jgi:hypothetical protein